MKKVALMAAPLLCAAASAPAPAQLGAGGYAPEVAAKAWFNEPPGTSLADLRGRVVFIEFWATW